MVPAEDIWQEETTAAVQDLDRARRRHGWDLVDAAVYTAALGVVTHAVARATLRVGAELVTSTRAVMTEAAQGLDRFIARVGGGPAHRLDDVRLQRVLDARRSGIEAMRRQTAAHLSGVISERITDRLAQAVPGRWDARRMVDRLGESLEGEWWQVERVVRTETAFAYNAAQSDAIGSLANDHRGMMKRWTELVNDATGLPMDNRVAPDSMVLHGQLTIPGGLFVMPPDERVSSKLVGKSWAFPPNRPNDRAVVTPWMRGWGIPGWTWNGVRRIPLR